MSDTQHKRPYVVMVVDDEAVITRSLAAFLELETDHQVIQFQSPLEAIKYLKQSRIDVVVSDFLMPEMNGIEFLAEVKKLRPDVPRIILTGYADKENSIRAINEVGIYQYLEKPWDNDQLKYVVNNALERKTLHEQLNDRIRALDNALLERDRLAARDEHLRSELELARQLQRSMLPSSLPGGGVISLSAFYEPALEIGGDFYDVIPLANNRHAILVADATGHGIQAALSTAVLKFAFQSFANCECSPQEVLKGMNRVLWQGLPDDIYVAALVASIDMQTRHVELANAGLPTPMLIRTAAQAVERVPATGLMLGAVDDDLYNPRDGMSIDLQSGDKLLVYTDGLSEAQNDAGEQFEDCELAKQLTAHGGRATDELHEILVNATREYAHEAHEWDDITILGIEVR